VGKSTCLTVWALLLPPFFFFLLQLNQSLKVLIEAAKFVGKPVDRFSIWTSALPT
jgi:hypothetical protein